MDTTTETQTETSAAEANGQKKPSEPEHRKRQNALAKNAEHLRLVKDKMEEWVSMQDGSNIFTSVQSHISSAITALDEAASLIATVPDEWRPATTKVASIPVESFKIDGQYWLRGQTAKIEADMAAAPVTLIEINAEKKRGKVVGADGTRLAVPLADLRE